MSFPVGVLPDDLRVSIASPSISAVNVIPAEWTS